MNQPHLVEHLVLSVTAGGDLNQIEDGNGVIDNGLPILGDASLAPGIEAEVVHYHATVIHDHIGGAEVILDRVMRTDVGADAVGFLHLDDGMAVNLAGIDQLAAGLLGQFGGNDVSAQVVTFHRNQWKNSPAPPHAGAGKNEPPIR